MLKVNRAFEILKQEYNIPCWILLTCRCKENNYFKVLDFKMHNLNLRQTLKKLKLCQFLLVKWVQIRAEMIHKQVMNVYVIKDEDKKEKKPLGKICIVVFFFLSKEPNLSPADL